MYIWGSNGVETKGDVNVIDASLFDDVYLDHVCDTNNVLSPQFINFNIYETVFEIEEDDWELSSVNSELMIDKSMETMSRKIRELPMV